MALLSLHLCAEVGQCIEFDASQDVSNRTWLERDWPLERLIFSAPSTTQWGQAWSVRFRRPSSAFQVCSTFGSFGNSAGIFVPHFILGPFYTQLALCGPSGFIHIVSCTKSQISYSDVRTVEKLVGESTNLLSQLHSVSGDSLGFLREFQTSALHSPLQMPSHCTDS